MLEEIKKIGSDAFKVVEEHSPEICLVAGIAGAVVSTVLACKSTIKAKEIVENATEELEDVNKAQEIASEEYTKEDIVKDKFRIVARTAVSLAKTYGPSAILLCASIGLLISGHKIMRKRNLALVAAYEGVSSAYKRYQEKVKDLIGEDAVNKIKYGLEEKEIEEDTGKKNKDGTPKMKKKNALVINGNPIDMMSPYCKIYDCGCRNWENNADYNLMFLKDRQNWWNDVLRTRPSHTVFLNEIYKDLGFQETKAGQIVGWSLKDGETNGDGYIDFGIFNLAYQPNVDFVNGYEPVCVLDFNVDGVVLDRLGDGEDGSIQA